MKKNLFFALFFALFASLTQPACAQTEEKNLKDSLPKKVGDFELVATRPPSADEVKLYEAVDAITAGYKKPEGAILELRVFSFKTPDQANAVLQTIQGEMERKGLKVERSSKSDKDGKTKGERLAFKDVRTTGLLWTKEAFLFMVRERGGLGDWQEFEKEYPK